MFSKNRDRLLTPDVAQSFFAEVNRLATRFMSYEHFIVDGSLIQAWASRKTFRKKVGPMMVTARTSADKKRSNETHQSATDPESRLYKKSYGKKSKLASTAEPSGIAVMHLAAAAAGWSKRPSAG